MKLESPKSLMDCLRDTLEPSVTESSEKTMAQTFSDLYSPTMPKFPSLAELVENDQKVSTEERSPGVYVELFRGKPEVLLQDAMANKQDYDAPLVELLTQLYTGKKSLKDLGEPERLKLNQATMEYLMGTRPDGKKIERVQVAKPKDPEPVEAPSPVGGDDLPAYWWLR